MIRLFQALEEMGTVIGNMRRNHQMLEKSAPRAPGTAFWAKKRECEQIMFRIFYLIRMLERTEGELVGVLTAPDVEIVDFNVGRDNCVCVSCQLDCLVCGPDRKICEERPISECPRASIRCIECGFTVEDVNKKLHGPRARLKTARAASVR